jgi:hypothetical protein
MAHGSRAHARWSASSSERNFACPGALALIERMGVEDRETEAAAWGTACHQVAERCLRAGDDADKYILTIEKTKSFSFVFDEEMAECTQVFLDYVRGRMTEYSEAGELYHPDGHACSIPEATLLIEQQFDLSPINPPFEAGGTGDAVLLFPAWGMIEVVDLKTGRKWVEAEGNKQTRTYALGAAIANKGPWTRVRSTIVQPRVGDDAVRSEEIDICDLLDWTTDLLEAMHASAALDAPLIAGDHCHATFCPAAGRGCPAMEAKALEAAHTFFAPVEAGAVAVAQPPDPRTMPVEKVVGVLDAADMIENWLNGVRQYARELVEAGETVGDYILVDKQARRKWLDAEDLPSELTKRLGIPESGLYESKLKSPAQIDKLAGKQGAKIIADLWTKESSGTNLVRSDKTTRVPAIPAAQKFFSIEKE